MKPQLKRIILITASLLFLIISTGCLLFAPRTYTIPTLTPTQNGDRRIMTFNLRYSSSDISVWDNRKDAIIQLIEDYQPDTIGFQEADRGWMDYLPQVLEHYSFYGIGRDDGDTQGEYAPIFYLTEKYILLDSGTFWLSETPDEPSYGWDANNKRICSYVVLEDIETGEVFSHFNTHLDHVGKEAREKGATLILDKTREMRYPVVLSGDMNVFEGSKVYHLFENSAIGDSKHLAENTMSWGTMNYFTNYHLRYVPPIDFIFVDENSFTVRNYWVLYQQRVDGKPLSDHYPVITDINYTKEARAAC